MSTFEKQDPVFVIATDREIGRFIGYTSHDEVVVETADGGVSIYPSELVRTSAKPKVEYRWTNVYKIAPDAKKSANGLVHYSAWYTKEAGCISAGQSRQDKYGEDSWIAVAKVKLVDGVPQNPETYDQPETET